MVNGLRNGQWLKCVKEHSVVKESRNAQWLKG